MSPKRNEIKTKLQMVSITLKPNSLEGGEGFVTVMQNKTKD